MALIAGTAEVRYDASVVLPQSIANRVTELGYPAELIERTEPNAIAVLVEGDATLADFAFIQSANSSSTTPYQCRLRFLKNEKVYSEIA